MTACFCPACARAPAPTYTEGYRAACEARMVVGIRGVDGRRAYLELVEKKRGAASRERLEADVLREWGKK